MTSRKSRPDTAKGPVEEMRRILTERTPEAVSFLVEVICMQLLEGQEKVQDRGEKHVQRLEVSKRICGILHSLAS